MADYGSRTGQAFSGAASGVATGSIFGVPGAIVGGLIGLGSGLFSKSDEEIRKEQIREYLKRLAELRAKSLERLSAETQKNFGRINQRTTGLLQRAQGDIGRRAAGSGRTADEADFLAAQGQITGQGSQLLQSTQDASDRARRQLEDYYDQQALAAESEGIFAPTGPNFTDVLDSLAPAALQYAMNRNLLESLPNMMTAPKVDVNTGTAIGAQTQNDTVPIFMDEAKLPSNRRNDNIYTQTNTNNFSNGLFKNNDREILDPYYREYVMRRLPRRSYNYVMR